MKALVRRAGFLTTVQDLGRTGFRDRGVTLSGALDPRALRVANALVGNEDGAAGLELTVGELRLRFGEERLIAWCGGDFEFRIAAERVPAGHSVLVRPDEELIAIAPQPSSRAWLAISGGIDVPLVLGSRSTDLRGSFGGIKGRALRDGDVLPLGELSPLAQAIARMLRKQQVSTWAAQPDWAHPGIRAPFFAFVRGADWERFPRESQDALVRELFTVSPDSNRIGVRLRGNVLHPLENGDLISEAVAPGTLQVPPDGNPILLLNDCQTIGGYPKIAHVITVGLSAAALLRAGDVIRFHEVTLEKAHAWLRQREEDFARFRIGLQMQIR